MADESEQRTRAQVWEAVRRLSDHELKRVQQLILAPSGSSSSTPQPRKDAIRIPLTLVEADEDNEAAPGHTTAEALEDNQADSDAAPPPPAKKKTKSARLTQWSPSDLIHAFLEHLHHTVHCQQAVSASAAAASEPPPVAGKVALDSNAQRAAKPTTGTASSSSKSSPFALQSDDFPSLLSAPQPPKTAAKTPNAPHKPNVKAAKRRITTTLLSEQNVITRPVLHAVAFPPLGGGSGAPDATSRSQSTANSTTAKSNPWAKRELLERRMMSSVEQPGGAAVAESPAQSPVLTKSRVGHHHDTTDAQQKTNQTKKLFDDSPPGGPKRVQPFPAASSVRPDPVASCQSPAMVTTPLKSSSSSVQQPPPMLLCVKPKRRQSLLTTTASEPSTQLNSPALDSEVGSQSSQQQLKTAQDFAPNVQAAKLYAFLISKRLVGSTCTELQLLISLLFRTNCTGAVASSGSEAAAQSFDTGATPGIANCVSPSELCWRSHCLAFAAAVLDGIEPILGSLGSELLQLLTSSLADAGICAEMLARLAQLTQRREELRVEESARIGCKLPVETRASAVRDFALPFCEEMDSRLHYRSPTESVLYSNREKVRDSFLDLLRHFQKQQHSLLGIESVNVAASAVASANNLLSEVSPENRWWFAKFFVLELIQVGANPFGESDKDLVLKIMGEDKLVVKNPDRLRKLHRRFSSQKQSTKVPQPTASTNQGGSSGGSTNNSHSNKNHRGGSSFSNNNNNNSNSSSKSTSKSDRNENNNNTSSKSSPASSSSSDSSSTAITATFETTRGYFAENQQFFFHFLHSCDSYEFSQLVKYQLEAQFQAIWKDGSSSATADARKSFTDVVLKLKVVAKFLGYLRFSPHWHNSSSLVQLSKQNPAFQAAKKEAIWTLENAESVGLDVKLLLEQSVVDTKLSKCIPWLCDYLTMLSLDKLSLATTYFKQLLVLLERIYHSKRLDALGETGLYIGMQIERVFHVLDFDVAGFLDDTQLRSPALQPSASLLQALENVELFSPSTLTTQRNNNGGGEDTLPFLYSQVFVQSCVNELEDLRGFIQTRAKPSHRVTRLVAGDGLSQTIPIRKLRPLQVVTEEEHNDELLLLGKTDATSAAQPSSSSSSSPGSFASTLSDDDKLSESIFKIHPNLRKVVEFVVEVVATNICEHVLQQIVTPGADAFIRSCVSESGLNPRGSSSSSAAAAELDSATILFLQLLENRTARTIQESVSKSLSEANRLCEDKVRASVPPLIPPSCHPTLAKSVTLVALNRTRSVVRNLIPKSSRSEFLKRLAFRKKAILKETATKSAAQASVAAAAAPSVSSSSTSEEDNVVRTLSSMFDEHAGVEDSSQDEILLELKQTSVQIFKLCSTRHAKALPDEWAKLHASLSRYVRSFTSSLEELESESSEKERPENDPETARRQIHELPVWSATWRVVIACLRVMTRLTHNVASWADSSSSSSLSSVDMPTKALEKAVSGFVDSFVSLLTLVLADESHDDHDLSHEEENVESRRVAGLIRVVTDCLLSTPTSLQLELSGHSDQSALLVERFVLTPRACILAAIASLTPAASLDARTALSPHASKGEQSIRKAKDFQSESSLSAELRERLRARDC